MIFITTRVPIAGLPVSVADSTESAAPPDFAGHIHDASLGEEAPPEHGRASLSGPGQNTAGAIDERKSAAIHSNTGGELNSLRRGCQHAIDAGVCLTGGRVGSAAHFGEDEETQWTEEDASTLPPPYSEIRFSH